MATSTKLAARLGEGAAGVVYGAHRVPPRDAVFKDLTNRYAVKILNPLQHIANCENGYDRMCKRFVQEATRGRHLSHANLIEIVASGTIVDGPAGSAPCCIMSLVDGEPLYNLLAQPAPFLLQRLRQAIDLGGVLLFMHDKGVLHRDVKPANVLVEKATGKLLLSDFGVVRWSDLAAHYTDGVATYSSEILTTWSYLPPEVEIDPETYDAVAEVWSYGKTVAELMTWQQIPRGSLLTGVYDLADHMGSRFARGGYATNAGSRAFEATEP